MISSCFSSVKPYSSKLVLAAFLTSLISCGGGSDSGEPQIDPDSMPEGFEFSAITDAALSQTLESASYTVVGINQAVEISVSQGAEYAINSGAYTSDAGTVNTGDVVSLRVTTSDLFNDTVAVTASLGEAQTSFSVTTASFSGLTIPAAEDAALNSTISSQTLTLDGFSGTASIAIAGGSYSIDGGEFSSTEGSITSGASLQLQGLSSTEMATATTVAVTIGGVESSFYITTLADTQAPEVEVVFPPENSMTEANTVLMRGRASDDFNSVSSVVINTSAGASVAVTSDDGYATWQAEVPLVDGDNTLTVTANDASGNASTSEQVRVHVDAELGLFPHSDVDVGEVTAITFDEQRNRLILGALSDSIFTVDLATGVRTVLSTNSTPGSEGIVIRYPEDYLVSADQQLAWVADALGSGLYSVDLETGARASFSGFNEENALVRPEAIMYVPDDNSRAWITDDVGLHEIDFETQSVIHTFDVTVLGQESQWRWFTDLFYNPLEDELFAFATVDGDPGYGMYSIEFTEQGVTISPFLLNADLPDELKVRTYLQGSLPLDMETNTLYVPSEQNQLLTIDLDSRTSALYPYASRVNSSMEEALIIEQLPDDELLVLSSYDYTGDRDHGMLAVLDLKTGHQVILSKWRQID
jgi:hypothetical protein